MDRYFYDVLGTQLRRCSGMNILLIEAVVIMSVMLFYFFVFSGIGSTKPMVGGGLSQSFKVSPG